GCVRIKRERVGKSERGDFRRYFAQWQQLNQPECEGSKQRQLKQIAADAEIANLPGVEHPKNEDRQSTEIEQAERPVVHSAVSERRKHDRDADDKKRKPAGERVPAAKHAMSSRTRRGHGRCSFRDREASLRV